MPNSEDYETLVIVPGISIKGVRLRGERIRRELGSGYGRSAVVGVAHGLHHFNLSAVILPDAALNVGTTGGKTWFAYYYDFFKTHTTGAEENFIVPWRDKHWHVRFVDTEISFEQIRSQLLTGGMEMQQVRVTGFTTYNSDGSAVMV